MMSVAPTPRPTSPPTTYQQEQVVRARLPRSVKCLAWEPRAGHYRAICLDFSLIAESRVGMLDVQRKLEAQIVDYLREVIAEGCPAHLVNRGLSRRERFELEVAIKQSELRAWFAGRFSRTPAAGDHARWHQPVTGCP